MMELETTALEIKSVSKYIKYEKNKFLDKYDGRPDGGTEAAAAPVSDFTFLATLWTGDYGHVALARHEPTGTTKTVMVMEAAAVARRTDQTRMDRNVMAAVSAFPFVARLEWLALDGVGRTYVVMPLVTACNLFELMAERGSFDEPTARFYTTQIVLAAEFLHASGLVHRNVKPENVLVNVNGYVRLANFGAAKHLGRGGRAYTLCGTPDYMAPEVVTYKGHGLAVDHWSLGVVLFEMAAGRQPFAAADVGAVFENAVRGRYRAPASFSPHLRSLIHGLVQTDLSKRLGNLRNGMDDIKNHPWFRTVDWLQIMNQKVNAPFKPNLELLSKGRNEASFWITEKDHFDF